MKKAIVLLVLMCFVSGCTLGPNYKRPKVDAPGSFRGAPAPQVAQTETTSSQTLRPETLSSHSAQPARNLADQTSLSSEQSFGDQKWWEVFQDPQLQELIRTALKQNYDVYSGDANSGSTSTAGHHEG